MAINAGADAGSADVSFDAERLDAYRVALQFQALLPQLLTRRAHPNLRDQLERASASIVLNLAEGAGRRARNEKAHYYSIARGSATESAAILDVLHARGVLSGSMHRTGRGLLLRLVQMLTKLVQKPVPVRPASP